MPVPQMDTTPIDRRPARWTVHDRLREWIEDGALAPGEVLKDAEIATMLGVSRTPVREALQMLERAGLVEMLPGRLTRVTDTTPEDIALVYATLGALNSLAAETAATRATSDDIAELRAHNEALLTAVKGKDPIAAREADRAFHRAIVRVAANRYLESSIEPLLIHIKRLEALFFRKDKPGRKSYDEHKRIISAIAAGDAAGAAEITRQNFTRFPTAVDS
jgi:DNA-binding GntR family transcriptional regulator